MEDILHTSMSERENKITNQNVVPYSPYLLAKFDCHINVEYCASVKAIKYIFKYNLKGTDQANVEVAEDEQNYDEIKSYINMRYVSSCEAV